MERIPISVHSRTFGTSGSLVFGCFIDMIKSMSRSAFGRLSHQVETGDQLSSGYAAEELHEADSDEEVE